MPAGLSGVVGASVLAALVLLALLAVEVFGTRTPDRFDRVVRATLHATWRPGPIAYAVDGLVSVVPVLIVTALCAAVAVATGRRRLAVVALAPMASYVVTSALKPLVGRTIHGDNLSFPSGHAAYATSLGLLVGLLLLSRFRVGRVAGALVLLGLGAVAGTGMAVDQVVLDAHYPSDAVGGFCTAVIVVGTLALLTDAVADRWAARVSG